MGGPAQESEEDFGSLVERARLRHPDELSDVVREYAAAAGFQDATIYLPDLQERQLRPLPVEDRQAEPPVNVDGTIIGRAFWLLEVEQGQVREGTRVFVPLLNGAERVGVLALVVDVYDELAARRVWRLACLVALLVVTRAKHSDTTARLRRTREMSLSAEVQWQLLPPLTLGTDALVISGALEPAYDVGGDVFDYGLSGSTAYLAIFDSMGHNLASGLAASIAIASWRHSRRQMKDLDAAAAEIDHAVFQQFDAQRYVTGVLATLDIDSGLFRWVIRGHPAPLLLRGGKWVKTLECHHDPPMGLGLPASGSAGTEELEPEDRVLLYSDGVVDTRNAAKEFFGLERFTDFILRQEADGLPAPETLRRLMHGLLDYHEERLDDDASVLLVNWRGRHGAASQRIGGPLVSLYQRQETPMQLSGPSVGGRLSSEGAQLGQ